MSTCAKEMKAGGNSPGNFSNVRSINLRGCNNFASIAKSLPR
jgi:hypothetical protein